MMVSTGHSGAPRSGVLYPPASLGVVGSGQLGRMFIQAAQRMGYRAGVLAAADDDPAAQVAHWSVIGASDELAVLREFRAKAEAVTVEFENVSAAALRWLARDRIVRPGWQTAWISQNRLREKSFLTRHRVPHTPWCAVRNGAELDAAVRKLGLPLILKTSSSGYDGKGQILVKTAEEAPRPGMPWAGRPPLPKRWSISRPSFPWWWPGAMTGGPFAIRWR